MIGSGLIRPASWRDDLATIFRRVAAEPCDHALRLSWKPAKTRNDLQNAKLNAMCDDIARQKEWHGQWLSKDDWRHMFVAAYRKGQRVVPGVDGGFVVLGASSRDLAVGECSDVIEMLFAFGAEHGIRWSA